jgi:hypothetical protein
VAGEQVNAAQAKALVAAYLSRKAADALRTHVGASLLREHLKAALGYHPEGGDLERIKQAVVEFVDELSRRGNVLSPFGNGPSNEPDDALNLQPQREAPQHEATNHARAARARRRVRG